MSTITGSCGVSEAQLMFERGIKEQQTRDLQANPVLDAIQDEKTASGQAINLSASLTAQLTVAEPNKGENIDVYV